MFNNTNPLALPSKALLILLSKLNLIQIAKLSSINHSSKYVLNDAWKARCETHFPKQTEAFLKNSTEQQAIVWQSKFSEFRKTQYQYPLSLTKEIIKLFEIIKDEDFERLKQFDFKQINSIFHNNRDVNWHTLDTIDSDNKSIFDYAAKNKALSFCLYNLLFSNREKSKTSDYHLIRWKIVLNLPLNSADLKNKDFKKDDYLEIFKTAIKYVHVQALELLKSEGIQTPLGKGYSPLHEAIKRGHLEMVALLIQNFGNLEQRDMSASQYTPLQEAIFSNNIKMTRFLISKGANINAEYLSDHGDDNAIYEVMRNVRVGAITIEMLRLLMNSGLQVENHDIRAEINEFLGNNIKKNDNASNDSTIFFQPDAKSRKSENNNVAAQTHKPESLPAEMGFSPNA